MDSGLLTKIAYVAAPVGAIGGAYHGYKRNNSVGWAIGWALLGGAFWPIAIPVALAQGFGKRRGLDGLGDEWGDLGRALAPMPGLFKELNGVRVRRRRRRSHRRSRRTGIAGCGCGR